MILITREESRVVGLKSALDRYNIDSVAIPVLSINKLLVEVSKIDGDVIIFISSYAAEFFININGVVPNKLAVAVGPKTAKTLQDNGWKNCIVPNVFNSQGILDLFDSSSVKGKLIQIVCGYPFKAWLGNELVSRGAKVEYKPVYTRGFPVQKEVDRLVAVSELQVTGVTVSSMYSLLNLHAIIIKYNLISLQKPVWFVISIAMRDKLLELGYSNLIIVVENATNEAIAEAIIARFNKG